MTDPRGEVDALVPTPTTSTMPRKVYVRTDDGVREIHLPVPDAEASPGKSRSTPDVRSRPETLRGRIRLAVVTRRMWSVVTAVSVIGGVVGLYLVMADLLRSDAPAAPIGEQLAELRSGMQADGWGVRDVQTFELRSGVESHVFALERRQGVAQQLRIYDEVGERLQERVRFTPFTYTGGEQAFEIRVRAAGDLDEDSDNELIVDLRRSTKMVRQMFPIVFAWHDGRREYLLQPLLRQPVRLPDVEISDRSERFLRDEARAEATRPYEVRDRNSKLRVRAYAFGSYAFVGEHEVMSAYRIGNATTGEWNVRVAIQLWSAQTSLSGGQIALGRCEMSDGQRTFIEEWPVVVDDDYATQLEGYFEQYDDYFGQRSCRSPFD